VEGNGITQSSFTVKLGSDKSRRNTEIQFDTGPILGQRTGQSRTGSRAMICSLGPVVYSMLSFVKICSSWYLVILLVAALG
jgi:hypothetical protein